MTVCCTGSIENWGVLGWPWGICTTIRVCVPVRERERESRAKENTREIETVIESFWRWLTEWMERTHCNQQQATYNNHQHYICVWIKLTAVDCVEGFMVRSEVVGNLLMYNKEASTAYHWHCVWWMNYWCTVLIIVKLEALSPRCHSFVLLILHTFSFWWMTYWCNVLIIVKFKALSPHCHSFVLLTLHTFSFWWTTYWYTMAQCRRWRPVPEAFCPPARGRSSTIPSSSPTTRTLWNARRIQSSSKLLHFSFSLLNVNSSLAHVLSVAMMWHNT